VKPIEVQDAGCYASRFNHSGQAQNANGRMLGDCPGFF